jgi:hypothetical protein
MAHEQRRQTGGVTSKVAAAPYRPALVSIVETPPVTLDQ